MQRPRLIAVVLACASACGGAQPAPLRELANAPAIVVPDAPAEAAPVPGLVAADAPLDVDGREDGATSGEARQSALDAPQSVEIVLERTVCYGWCPSYTVAIRGDGSVRYTGRDFVREIGERTARISATALSELVARFDAAKFDELDDAYVQKVSDHPFTYLTFARGGRSKRVTNYWSHADPERVRQLGQRGFVLPNLEIHQRLDELANAIDAAVEIERWIGSHEERADHPDHFECPPSLLLDGPK